MPAYSAASRSKSPSTRIARRRSPGRRVASRLRSGIGKSRGSVPQRQCDVSSTAPQSTASTTIRSVPIRPVDHNPSLSRAADLGPHQALDEHDLATPDRVAARVARRRRHLVGRVRVEQHQVALLRAAARTAQLARIVGEMYWADHPAARGRSRRACATRARNCARARGSRAACCATSAPRHRQHPDQPRADAALEPASLQGVVSGCTTSPGRM